MYIFCFDTLLWTVPLFTDKKAKLKASKAADQPRGQHSITMYFAINSCKMKHCGKKHHNTCKGHETTQTQFTHPKLLPVTD